MTGLTRLRSACSVLMAFVLVSSAFAENIVSRPAGFIRFDLSPKSQTLVSMPFDLFNPSLQGILSGQLMPDDRVLTWDASRQVYVGAVKTVDGWVDEAAPMNPSGITLSSDDAFWIENNQPTGQIVYLFGRAVFEGQISVNFQPLLNVYGYPYSTAFGDWALGQGYWFDNPQTQSVAWTLSRPYEDISSPNELPPRIQALDLVPGGVSLEIDTAGLQGSQGAILYQDLTPTGTLDTTQGWLIAATDISVASDNVDWTDAGAPDRPSPTEIFARLYLVVRTDMDANDNGIPDISEGGALGQIATLSVSSVGAGMQEAGYQSIEAVASENNQEMVGQSPASTNSTSPAFVVYYARPVIYVDAASGSDHYSGKRPSRTSSDGPKKSIHAGLAAATEYDTVVIRGGSYGENLNIAGRSVDVRIEGNVNISGSAHMGAPQLQPVTSYTNSAGIVERIQP
ncbi:MAG: hypothetical protein V1929_08760 [bacterium]